LSSIKSSDNASLLELRDLARADRPIKELVALAQDILKNNEIRSKSRSRLKQAVISIAALTNEPLMAVPASPWTGATDDDAAVSHLLSVYFTWHHCAYPALDREIFVRNMQSRDLSSQYCSPLLVNAILAIACVSPEAHSTRCIDANSCIPITQQPLQTLPIPQQGPLILCKNLQDYGRPRRAECR
jgi:hypothetical protein